MYQKRATKVLKNDMLPKENSGKIKSFWEK